MVFRRRKSKRKFVRRSRRFRRFRRRRRMPVARPEVKVDNTEYAGLDADTAAGVVRGWTSISQGVAVNQRIGNRITVRSLSGTFTFLLDAQAGGTDFIRVSVWVDKQTEDSLLPSLAELYTDPDEPKSYRNVQTTGRFRLLWTRSFLMGPNSPQSKAKVVKMNYKFPRGLLMRWSDAVDPVNISKNLLFFSVQSDAAAVEPITINALLRTRYTDS